MRIGIQGLPKGDSFSAAVTQNAVTATGNATTWLQPPGIALPLISGKARNGEVLTCNVDNLNNVTAYQWLRDGVAISGATSATYTVAMMSDMGTVLSCRTNSDEGELTSPGVEFLHDHSEASHNAMDDAALALVPYVDATHVAVQDGNWTAPSTWQGGLVPTWGAMVIVPNGITVTYDETRAGIRLDRVRVDGTLTWSLTRSTNMLVETVIVSPAGEFIIGSGPTNRLPIQHTAMVTISGQHYSLRPDMLPTEVDFDGGDSTLMSRGIVALGKFQQWGANIEPHVRTQWGNAPMAGHTSVTIQSDGIPTGWAVGQDILIPSTKPIRDVFNGSTFDYEDEERTITSLTDNQNGTVTVGFDAALVYNHDHHNPAVTREDLQPHIVNLKRNIVFRSEVTSPSHRRGHIMVMHEKCFADSWHIELRDLGRTDKSIRAGKIEGSVFKVPTNDAVLDLTPDATSNSQGRYAYHFHQCGFLKDHVDVLFGALVRRAPGWGVSHHACEANMNFNVGIGVYGCFIVGEQGNEIGEWDSNIAISPDAFVTSVNGDFLIDAKQLQGSEGVRGDFFRQAFGFGMKGRAIRVTRNAAYGCSNGFAFSRRSDGSSITPLLDLDRDVLDIKDLNRPTTGTLMDASDYPIVHFVQNESYGCDTGFHVFKSQMSQGHDLNVRLRRHKSVGCRRGGHIQYVGSYAIQEIDMIAPATNADEGFERGANAAQIAVLNARTQGFTRGLRFDGLDTAGGMPSTGAAVFSSDDPLQIIAGHESINDQTARVLESFTVATSTTPASVTREFTLPPARVTVTENLPRVIMEGDFNAGTISNTFFGQKTDCVSSAAAIPKVWDLLSIAPEADVLNDFISGTTVRNYIVENGYWEVGSENYAIFPMYFSDRIYGDRVVKTMKAARMLEDPSVNGNYVSNGTFSWTTSGPIPADAAPTITMSVNTSATINVLTGATHADGTRTITLDDSFISPDFCKLILNTTPGDPDEGLVTIIPARNYRGTDHGSVFLYDGGGTFTRVDLFIEIDCTDAQPVAANAWNATGGAGEIVFTLTDKPDSGYRWIEETQYTTDGGATWKRLCLFFPLDPHTITTESDGTALSAGSYDVQLRYIVNIGDPPAASTAKTVTVT